MSGKLIHELTRGQCRFPVTPDHALKHFFCAEPVEREGVVYCAKHAKLCYDRRAPEKRRRDAEQLFRARASRSSKVEYLTGGRTATTRERLLSIGGTTADDLP